MLPLLAALLSSTLLTSGALKLSARLALPRCRPDDTATGRSANPPYALRHNTPLSLCHTLPPHAVEPSRALLLAPLGPAPPRPTTVTLTAPLLATLLRAAELTLGAS